MLSLSEFQFSMAADLLDGGTRTAGLMPDAPGLLAALRIHRNTVMAGLANALRLSCPTVAWLTGEAFFDQAAAAFASAHPPQAACLSDYGDGFAEYLENYPPAAGLVYLGDVARFDLAIQRCTDAAGGDDIHVALGDGVALALDGSLNMLAAEYPVDALRDAHGGDESPLAELDMAPSARNFAIWRAASGVMVRPLAPASASFLGAILRGENGEAGLAAALLHAAAADALAAIQAEIFTAPFARIQSPSQGEQT